MPGIMQCHHESVVSLSRGLSYQGGVDARNGGNGVAESRGARYVLEDGRQRGRQHSLQAALHGVLPDDLLQGCCIRTRLLGHLPHKISSPSGLALQGTDETRHCSASGLAAKGCPSKATCAVMAQGEVKICWHFGSSPGRRCWTAGGKMEEGEHVQGVPSAWLLAGVGRPGLGVWVGRSRTMAGNCSPCTAQ